MKTSKFFMATASAVLTSALLTAPASAGTLDQANWAIKFMNKKIVSMSGNNPRVRELVRRNEKAMDNLSNYQRLKKYSNLFRSSGSFDMSEPLNGGFFDSSFGGSVTPAAGSLVNGGSVTPAAGSLVNGGSVTPAAGSSVNGGSVNPAAGSSVTGGSVNPAAGSLVNGGSVNPAAGGSVSGGSVNPAAGSSVTGGSVNPAAGSSVTGGGVNPAAGSSVTGGSVNPAAGSSVTGGSVTPAAGGSVSGGSVNPLADNVFSGISVNPSGVGSIFSRFAPANYIPTFTPAVSSFTFEPPFVTEFKNPLTKFAQLTSLAESNPYAFALTHPQLAGTAVNAAGTAVNAAGSLVKSTLGGIGSLFGIGRRSSPASTSTKSANLTPAIVNPAAENSTPPTQNLSTGVKISASVESKISVEINSSKKVSSGYTGVIVDCRGLNARRAMSPVIKNVRGDIIYGDKNIDPDKVVEIGMVGYATNMSDENISRAGSKPLVVRALDVVNFGDNPVISLEDGDSILTANGASKFLEQGNVVFLVD